LRSIQGITRDVNIREVSTLQLKKIYMKRCQVFTTHMEEAPKDKVASVENCTVLKEYDDVFKEILILPPKRDIDFSINLMSGETTISKTTYRMSKPELKEFHMKLEDLLKKGYILPSVSPWGALVLFTKKKDGTLRLCIKFR
jgi:hypothetical protein